VKNWNFVGNGVYPENSPYVYVGGIDASKGYGVRGQGNPNPPSGFFQHFIVRYNDQYYDQYYDPAYGNGPRTHLTWENEAIAGFAYVGDFGNYKGVALIKRKYPSTDPNSVETIFTP
jgi:hypothetical protein